MKRSLSWKSSAWQCSYDLKSEMCVKKQLLTPGNLSSSVVDYVFGTNVPRPCRWFLWWEPEQLYELLVNHSKVFLYGIPGSISGCGVEVSLQNSIRHPQPI